MDLKPHIFCDWLTVKQRHLPHDPFGAINIYIDPDTGAENHTRRFIQINGEHESSVLLRSDGETVEFSGNPSRWNRENNIHGISLDQAKATINKILESKGLPEFTSEYQIMADGKKYTGAKINRMDITTNLQAGSARKKDMYLNWIQTQEYPKLKKQCWFPNTYFGKESVSRTFRIYDKALQITETKGDKQAAIRLQNKGVIRYEWQYMQYLKTKGFEMWHRATQDRIETQFNGDIQPMTKTIKKLDIESLPSQVMGTYLMYKEGIDPRNHMAKSTFYIHRKTLLPYGIDISNQTVVRLKQEPVFITPEPYYDKDQLDLLEG